MPRRPRVDMVGYYHIVNRGVEQRITYKEDEDYEIFLEMLCMICQHFMRHRIRIVKHSFHLVTTAFQSQQVTYSCC